MSIVEKQINKYQTKVKKQYFIKTNKIGNGTIRKNTIIYKIQIK